jgi:hypothetical protein
MRALAQRREDAMTPADNVTRIAEALGNGLDCLAVFLCDPALRAMRSEAPGLLRRWEADYAPTFREATAGVRRSNRAKLHSALARIAGAATGGVDLDAAEQLASLRLAIREAIVAFEFPLPELTPDEAAICALHGPACPMLGRTGE